MRPGRGSKSSSRAVIAESALADHRDGAWRIENLGVSGGSASRSSMPDAENLQSNQSTCARPEAALLSCRLNRGRFSRSGHLRLLVAKVSELALLCDTARSPVNRPVDPFRPRVLMRRAVFRAHRRRVQDRLSGRRSVAAHVGMGLAGRRHRHSSVVQDRSGHRQDNVLPAFHGLHQSSSAAADLLGRQGDAGWRLNGLPNVMRERREACVPWRSARRRACRRRAADRRRPCRPATLRA